MKRRLARGLTLFLVLLIGLIVVSTAVAQGGAFLANWQVMGSGGGSASAGSNPASAVTLNDTLGQPIAGPAASGDGAVQLGTGYWPGVGSSTYSGKLYLPLVRR